MITISTDKTKLDIDFIYNFLNNSYWAKGRTKETIAISIANSMCFGLYQNSTQIGFARILTDKVVFSYLMDVFIDPGFQGKQYGKKLLEAIYKHVDLIAVQRHYLMTKDAQYFYKKFGFEVYPNPEKFMYK